MSGDKSKGVGHAIGCMIKRIFKRRKSPQQGVAKVDTPNENKTEEQKGAETSDATEVVKAQEAGAEFETTETDGEIKAGGTEPEGLEDESKSNETGAPEDGGKDAENLSEIDGGFSHFVDGDVPDHNCNVSVNIVSTDRRKPGRLRVCKGDICDILEPGQELKFYGYIGDSVTVEVVE